ncbi:Dual specificity protein phosphatase 19 [Mycena indigotica]|uniref:Dual specificity protein phosphatase 19 n=1 Tax=Mycena indigotica TaxID=2126181 RepID=A0A8H6WG54_9AGAR|nr:Dual specificity protein phosphatase 19 [Mycena indigotica]KAF7316472.1 Dual specificity protein phosphatase 19 [Mycena indigotica]
MPKKSKKNTPSGSTGGEQLAAVRVLPYLYLGPRTAVRAAFCSAQGITHVLSIGSTPAEIIPSITYERLSLVDSASSPIAEASSKANAIILAIAKSGGKILVHCSAAVSRSPTLVALYLMEHSEMSLHQALRSLVLARPSICPNPGFFAQLKDAEVALRGTCSVEVDSLPLKREVRVALFQLEE